MPCYLTPNNSHTESLRFEFMDSNCSQNGFLTGIIKFNQEEAIRAWECQQLYYTLCTPMRTKIYTTLQYVTLSPDITTFEETRNDPWHPANEEGQLALLVCSRSVNDPRWWLTILLSIRKWFKSDEFFEEYGVRFGVALLMQSGSTLC